MITQRSLKFLFSLLLFIGLSLGLVAAQPSIGNAKEQFPPIKPGAPIPADLFVRLAKAINPTVVNISTSTRPQPQPRQPFRHRDPFFDLFEQFMGPQFQMRPRESLGTGFVIRKDGLIITNNHVVDKADIIKVSFTDDRAKGEGYDAKVVGRDGRTDIALIKISAKKDLPIAPLGSSSQLQVGEWVAAFGNPFGHGHTVTKGIISAKGREIDELNRFAFLQTDASINPGNSGGPLVNTQGQVIGVNTAIDRRAQGIGFAIPIDSVKSILPELEKTGGIKRGFLGVLLADIDPRSARSLKLKTTDGALITQTVPDSPAEKAGMKPYDLIIQFGKDKVRSSRDLMKAVGDTRIGQKIKVVVIRNGKSKNLTVKVAPHPDDTFAVGTHDKTYKGQNAPYNLGFRVADYSQTLAREFDLKRLRRGRPVVIDVAPGSPASRNGLAPGDIILEINRKSVYTAKDVLRRGVLREKDINVLRILRQDQAALVYLQSE